MHFTAFKFPVWLTVVSFKFGLADGWTLASDRNTYKLPFNSFWCINVYRILKYNLVDLVCLWNGSNCTVGPNICNHEM